MKKGKKKKTKGKWNGETCLFTIHFPHGNLCDRFDGFMLKLELISNPNITRPKTTKKKPTNKWNHIANFRFRSALLPHTAQHTQQVLIFRIGKLSPSTHIHTPRSTHFKRNINSSGCVCVCVSINFLSHRTCTYQFSYTTTNDIHLLVSTLLHIRRMRILPCFFLLSLHSSNQTCFTSHGQLDMINTWFRSHFVAVVR